MSTETPLTSDTRVEILTGDRAGQQAVVMDPATQGGTPGFWVMPAGDSAQFFYMPEELRALEQPGDGPGWDETYYRQRPRRKSIEEVYRHAGRSDALYVRVLGGVIEAGDFYDDRHYDGVTLWDYYYGPASEFGRVEHLAAADLVRVEEIDGRPASEWVYDTYVRRDQPATEDRSSDPDDD